MHLAATPHAHSETANSLATTCNDMQHANGGCRAFGLIVLLPNGFYPPMLVHSSLPSSRWPQQRIRLNATLKLNPRNQKNKPCPTFLGAGSHFRRWGAAGVGGSVRGCVSGGLASAAGGGPVVWTVMRKRNGSHVAAITCDSIGVFPRPRRKGDTPKQGSQKR